ncbi:nitrile hydratase subunit beta [Rhizobium straminoryzae]|uniref:Nitrile hydratase subunit beta n=1 Tax=Rhizobium straminoryzae TaxID=1387186 RepID=A0A549SY15_9HYPH|nr:nitrile hydratase subunit beta [Rhizobium straminoryzae]TRL34522.1 nitrile hydratase subunit beta [Rhizobium straminoryzae]
MNTANPQLEGLYLAVAAINRLLVEKQLLTHEEIRETLREAETLVLANQDPQSVSAAHHKAVAFPIRLLILANDAAEHGETADFEDLTRQEGRST